MRHAGLAWVLHQQGVVNRQKEQFLGSVKGIAGNYRLISLPWRT